jgi:hypothetical protein
MNLLQPTNFAQEPLILIISPPFSYTDNTLQLTATVSMHLGFFFNLKPGEEASMIVPDLKPTIQHQYQNYNRVRQFINICANTGEAVDDTLLSVLEKAYPERKADLAKLDFTKRRDEFSNLIKKSDLIKTLPEFDSSTKRKEITTTFTQFVKLRNYYTHGKLILKYDTEIYYVQIIDKPTGIKTTHGIDRNILTSFIETGAELIRLLTLIMKST